jgi:hypothetical protein
MSSRSRLIQTLNHTEPEKIVVDFGSSLVTGISAMVLADLRKALDLPYKLVKVYEPMQLLGEIEEDMRQALGIDVVGVSTPMTVYGYKNDKWKKWTAPNGEEVLIGDGFTYTIDEKGDTYVYPASDLTANPSAKLPNGGYYFDNLVRQGSIEDEDLNAKEDFKNDFPVMPGDIVAEIKQKVDYYHDHTEYGINLGNFLSGLGDVAALPGPAQKITKGIRSMEDWLVAHYTNPEYIKDVYDFQYENAIVTLNKLHNAVGDKPQVIQISGTDFGTQRTEIISPAMYREFYKPYHEKLNAWVHENTVWKTMYHSCGSVVNLLDDFADAGIDILNPVQCSAEGMDPKMLKEKYGDKFVFWGAGVDTQNTLPFGTPDEVYAEVSERLRIFAPGGGFVFNAIHNVQAKTPIKNILAMFRAINDYNKKH